MILFNDEAEKLFEKINLDNFTVNDNYLILKKIDKYSREYYGISHFCNEDNDISIDTELSSLE